MFGLDLAVSVALGRVVAGGLFPAASPAKAVYLAAEESERMLANRLRTLTRLDERADPNLHQNLVVFPLLGKEGFLIKASKTTPLFDHTAKSRTAPMDIQQLFQERLPRRPRCTDDFKDGVRISARKPRRCATVASNPIRLWLFPG